MGRPIFTYDFIMIGLRWGTFSSPDVSRWADERASVRDCLFLFRISLLFFIFLFYVCYHHKPHRGTPSSGLPYWIRGFRALRWSRFLFFQSVRWCYPADGACEKFNKRKLETGTSGSVQPPFRFRWKRISLPGATTSSFRNSSRWHSPVPFCFSLVHSNSSSFHLFF